jgi:uncharacterized protein (TIGR03032 family)
MSEPVPNSENSTDVPSTTARAVDFEHSRELGAFLEQLGVTLLVSTYQAGKLVAASGVDGQLQLTFHNFESPMGLAANGKRVWVGCKTQVWELTNAPQIARQLPPVGRHDACYLTRRAHITGNLQGHELAWTGGELWIVNTLFSCLCTLSADYSFAPRWRPPFISGLAAEDRCHLNGLAFDSSGVRYVTALGQTDEPGGWRPNKAAGGVLIEVPSGRCMLQGLCMPHSPRLHAGAVWLLDSGRGALVRWSGSGNQWDEVCKLPGYARGLAFCGPYALVGLSRIREKAVFGGLPIDAQRADLKCGVWVVDWRSGRIVMFLEFRSAVDEVFDVQVIPKTRWPILSGPHCKVDGQDNIWVVPRERG